MKRNSQNTNLQLHYEDTYQGLPVQTKHGPLILEYLDLLYLTLWRALYEHPRTFAFRVDLRFPKKLSAAAFLASNIMMERFFASFKAKIRHNRAAAKKKNPHAHDSAVRYVWARETSSEGGPHFHLVIFLNHDAFFTVGLFESTKKNIFHRLQEAWASALGRNIEQVMGLVHIPDNPCYYVQRDDQKSIEQLFYRASYLCKSDTKYYGNGSHGFGSSRS